MIGADSDHMSFRAHIQATGGEYETISSTQADHQGLDTSSMTLKFVVSHKHFNRGAMRLKCTATTGRAYILRAEIVSSLEPDEEEVSRLQRVSENLNQGLCLVLVIACSEIRIL